MDKSILDVLEQEHTVIESVLDALQRGMGGNPDWALIEEILDFLSGYADRFHHQKEEELLFPRMEARGVPRTHGPLGCMLEEHEQGRGLVARMREARCAEDGRALRAAAHEYIPLLRMHIAKENNILFPMARRALNAGDEAELSRRCAEITRADPEGERLAQSARGLLERAFSAKSH